MLLFFNKEKMKRVKKSNGKVESGKPYKEHRQMAQDLLFFFVNEQTRGNSSKCFGLVSGFSGLVSQVCGANCLTRLISNKCALIEA